MTRLRRATYSPILFLAIVVWSLTGCMAPVTGMPSYIVLLVSTHTRDTARCTGVALDAHTVLAVAHCARNSRQVVTISGQMTSVLPLRSWPEHDAAIYRTAEPLLLPEYAELVAVDTTKPGIFFGACPQYFTVTPRFVAYASPWLTNTDGTIRAVDMWFTLLSTQYACGGDSGSAIIQEHGVAGIISAVNRGSADTEGGRAVFTVPAVTVTKLIADYQAELQQIAGESPPLPAVQCRVENCASK